MKRFALDELIAWDKSSNRKPLIVWGARQVGKTYLIRTLFAESFYKNNHIYIDCKIEDEIRTFSMTTANAGKIIEFISVFKGKKITKDTLLIFDEVQECPNIVSALKYFAQDYRAMPVIVTGSMVRIKIQREIHKPGQRDDVKSKFLFPVGKINQITVSPMTFDEFLLNINEVLYETVVNSYKERVALPSHLHELVMGYLYKYLLVGGMPEVVDNYIGNQDLTEARKILRDLYDNYLSDMELYQASRESVLRSHKLFSNIFRELNKESKNFSPGFLEKGAKTRDYNSAIEWLTFAHLICQSFQLKEHVTIPLLPDSQTNFRFFLCDMGAFSYQSGVNAATFLTSDAGNTLAGIFFENYVAIELAAKGNKLYYWKGKNSAEIEFVVESGGKIYPIDVKKGRGSLNSVKKFSDHNKFEFAIKVSSNGYGYDFGQRLMTVPLYFISFLAKDIAAGNL